MPPSHKAAGAICAGRRLREQQGRGGGEQREVTAPMTDDA